MYFYRLVNNSNTGKDNSLFITSKSSLCQNKSSKKSINTSKTIVSKKQTTNSVTKGIYI